LCDGVLIVPDVSGSAGNRIATAPICLRWTGLGEDVGGLCAHCVKVVHEAGALNRREHIVCKYEVLCVFEVIWKVRLLQLRKAEHVSINTCPGDDIEHIHFPAIGCLN
jgi:hypothetical protein